MLMNDTRNLARETFLLGGLIAFVPDQTLVGVHKGTNALEKMILMVVLQCQGS